LAADAKQRIFGFSLTISSRCEYLVDVEIPVSGLHHVTAIASDPQRNLDFYADFLGLRLVKRTINFDDPRTYHFYYGDGRGTPGTILTFFPWPNARRGGRGTAQIDATGFSTAPESFGYWLDRLKQNHVNAERAPKRFGQDIIRFADPDGLMLELIASEREVEPWPESTVPAEHFLRGFHSVSAALEGYEKSAKLLTDVFGYELVQEEANRFRFSARNTTGPGRTIDLLCMPDTQHARGGAGTVHHIAFRTPDDASQRVCREQLVELGFNVSPVMDRTYFRSVYFREPGGILFEIATDPPGFTADETVEGLGKKLSLPSWMETARTQIEGVLPPITLPVKR
jgi:catechol 2,3-dioxygenase-like lactoylglutathione lyase family enzyme